MLNFNLIEACCCNRLVVNGGGALLSLVRFETFVTTYVATFKISSKFLASFSLAISLFLSSILHNSARKTPPPECSRAGFSGLEVFFCLGIFWCEFCRDVPVFLRLKRLYFFLSFYNESNGY